MHPTVHPHSASFTNTLTEIGHGHLLGRICFESMTTFGVECYFKGMRADQDLPTVAHYAYRRARCVEYDMLPISHILLGPIHFIRRKLAKRIKGEPPNIKMRPNQQSAIAEGTAKVAKTKTQGEKL